MVRVDGGLRPVGERRARGTATHVLRRSSSLLTPQPAASIFERELELDFAFTISANARFRVNFYQQRGSVGAAFRLIPTEIKQLKELGVPESVGSFSQLPARSRARHRPDRFGQVDDARRADRPGQHARVPTTS